MAIGDLATANGAADQYYETPAVDGVEFAHIDRFNVLFIGAGNVMFGSDEGPWNHSVRFERKLGPRLRVVGIVDPNNKRTDAVLQAKRESFVASSYEKTIVCATLDEFFTAMPPEAYPNIVVIGTPPMFRGGTKPGKNIELRVIEHFPEAALFVEKPVATGPLEELPDVFKVAKLISSFEGISSVGYMLRYLKGVQAMKKILMENKLSVAATIARYACAYSSIAKPVWWNKALSGGPVIEQATHFCDLSRYLGGEVDVTSVSAHSLEWYEEPAKLSKVPVDESAVAPENRIPRVTAATWKYASGAVGTLTHIITMQGTNYTCELEVHADGYMLKLVDAYVKPTLYVRRPGDDYEEKHTFADDDPFFSEISVLVDTVENAKKLNGGEDQILSSFEDAAKSYELTWAIRRASEQSLKKKAAQDARGSTSHTSAVAPK